MIFTDLTFSKDQWSEETQSHWGWQTQYETPNGYLCIVNSEFLKTPLTECCGLGQTYTIVVLPPNRSEVEDIVSKDSGLNPSQIEAKINEVISF
jgi:hypothetical protein